MPTERATERGGNGGGPGPGTDTHTHTHSHHLQARLPSAGPGAAGDAGSPCQVLRPRQRASVAPIHPCCTGPTAHRTERAARQNRGPGGGGLCSLTGPRARAARTKPARPVGCPHLPYPCLGGPRGTAPGHLTPPTVGLGPVSANLSLPTRPPAGLALSGSRGQSLSARRGRLSPPGSRAHPCHLGTRGDTLSPVAGAGNAGRAVARRHDSCLRPVASAPSPHLRPAAP